jgi:hypothetical protein
VELHVDSDRKFGSFFGRLGLRDPSDFGVCLLGVVYYRTSLLQEQQRPARLSRASRRAQRDDVVECLAMESFGQLSTPKRFCRSRGSNFWGYFVVSLNLASSRNFPIGGGELKTGTPIG